jgi:hypothetical protein
MFIRLFTYPECNNLIHNTRIYRREIEERQERERYIITMEREQKEEKGESSKRAINIGTMGNMNLLQNRIH